MAPLYACKAASVIDETVGNLGLDLKDGVQPCPTPGRGGQPRRNGQKYAIYVVLCAYPRIIT